jgi:hypothetical protein
MKLWIFGVGLLGVVAVSAALIKMANAPPQVTIATVPTGLSSVKSDNVEFLKSGQFRIEQVTLRKPNGETYSGATFGMDEFDQQRNELKSSLPWGTVKTAYTAAKNRLTLTITTTNTSDSETIEAVRYTPLALKFPEKVKEYDGSTPLLAHNLGQVAVVKVSHDSGTLAVVSEDLDKPLMVGFPWALNRPVNTEFPLSVHTGLVKSYPDSYPMIRRPIPPKSSDTYVVTLRFGRARASEDQLLEGTDKKLAEAYPQQLQWTDRRPIGAIFLATDAQSWVDNPRGWFGDGHVNVMTPAGIAEFHQRLLNLANSAIGVMRDMNAQGAITWDIEGQQFPHGTTYIGDPRKVELLAPEMAGVVDEYFARFKAAGLRTGITVRPQLLELSADKKTASQTTVADPTDLLIDKISYAKKRWGVSMIYIDSNTNATDPNPLEVAIIRKVAAAFPDCLLIPEHSNLRYFAYSAPSVELRHGIVSTPDTVRDAYPKAFSIIYTADGPLDLDHDALKAAVKRGDVLMYRTWYPDPQNEKVKAIYNNQ